MTGAAVARGGEAATTSLGRESAAADPDGVVAISRERTAWPTSALVGVYERAVAPAIAAQSAPAASQRTHSMRTLKSLPSKAPPAVESAKPRAEAPVSAGFAVTVGAGRAATGAVGRLVAAAVR